MWREIILQISPWSPRRAANLPLGRHQIQTWTTCSEWHAMFLHPEPYARPTQNISIPRGEELSLSQCCLTELFRYSKTVNALDNTSTCTWFVSKVRLLWQCANIALMFLIDSSALLIIVAVPTNKDYTLAEVCFEPRNEATPASNQSIYQWNKMQKQQFSLTNSTIIHAKLWFKR